MPKPQIANDYAALLNNRLRGWSNLATSSEQILLDPPASTIAVFALLVGNGGALVCTEPDLCGAVLWRHSHERNVYHESERDGGVIKVCIIMGRLRGRWR
jgi:hypothetical protein